MSWIAIGMCTSTEEAIVSALWYQESAIRDCYAENVIALCLLIAHHQHAIALPKL